ncbi:MAG: GNAT family N-acetyltransferase [Promethearchaeota archaeon]
MISTIVAIDRAFINAAQDIHDVLSESFIPFHQYYTKEAYRATVISVREIKNRILNKKTDVLIAICNNNLVGTATIEIQEKENWFIRSMAIKPDYQRKSIAYQILREIINLAKKKHARTLLLECFEPLSDAINLYQRSGFKKTGRKRNHYGIEIFEMIREVD